MAAQTPVLELSIDDRPVVIINRKRYELRTADEFSFLSHRQHAKQLQRLGHLLTARESLTAKQVKKADEQEMDRLLRGFVETILIAPPGVHAKLREVHRIRIVTVFSSLLRTSLSAGARQIPATNGHRSSPAKSPRG